MWHVVSIRAQRRIAARPPSPSSRSKAARFNPRAATDRRATGIKCDTQRCLGVSIRAQRRIAARREASRGRAQGVHSFNPRAATDRRATWHATAVNGSTLFQSARSDGSPRDSMVRSNLRTSASFNPRAATDRRATPLPIAVTPQQPVSIRAQRRIAARLYARAHALAQQWFQSARSDGSPRDETRGGDDASNKVSIRAQRRIAARPDGILLDHQPQVVSIRAQRRIAARPQGSR